MREFFEGVEKHWNISKISAHEIPSADEFWQRLDDLRAKKAQKARHKHK
jgi:hypothetical protein